MTFRFDINALRAIAIVGVMLFHYKFNVSRGGYAGVDVFFVISGYLMTRIIYNGLTKQTFSYLDFIKKRFLRIVPSLLFLVSSVSLICFFIYLPAEYMVQEKNALASSVFLSNVWYWLNSNYFDPNSETNLFLHTWSLSVEWQFYLLYPFILLLIRKFSKQIKEQTVLLFIIIVLICDVSIVCTYVYPTASFYLLPTRSWEMLLGGLAFLIESQYSQYKYSKLVAIIGYSLIGISFVDFDSTMSWPGFYTIVPVLGTFMILVANYSSLPLVNHSFVQFTGKISYSLYLWHWPLYVISQYFGVELDLGIKLLLIFMAYVLGYLSYKYIESHNFEIKTVSISFVSIMLGLVITSQSVTNKYLFKKNTLAISGYRNTHQQLIDEQMSVGKCFITSKYSGFSSYDKAGCLCFDNNKKNFLLLGDSHSAHLYLALSEALKPFNVNLLHASASGGLPTVDPTGSERFLEVMRYVYFDFIPKNKVKLDGVIISANWRQQEEGYLSEQLSKTALYLRKNNLKFILIGQSEVYTMPFPLIAARDSEYGTHSNARYLDKQAFIIDAYLKKQFEDEYINIINHSDFPETAQGNIPYMFDDNHLTSYGAALVAKKIVSDSLVINFLGSH
ncbi:acyltransferase family protein [Hymenobacter sp. IS2118]|uniref:acyltransferase family protein n=1 Tax=Hymenobacter sp. IS2118 TaxID=1505605 RepID=UPI001377E417|nr:acyltransferase family protein [Hymenobacter sp. IS2118]